MTIVGFHTQEHRIDEQPLDIPVYCHDRQAWLGFGYYFWQELEFAHYWGEDKKMNTGSYDIYSADIDMTHVLDACFDEESYNFFIEVIEKAIKVLRIETIDKKSLAKVHQFLKERHWQKNGIKGLRYSDIPKNSRSGRLYSLVPDLYYKKRIQIVVFDLDIIHNFAIYLDDQQPQIHLS